MKSVFAKTIYTGNSVRQNTFLVFSGRKISGLAPSRKGELIGEYAVVTPALIDAHSHIGLHRSGEPSAEGEANDHLDSIMALPDALDSVQMDDAAFQDAIEMGVLYTWYHVYRPMGPDPAPELALTPEQQRTARQSQL